MVDVYALNRELGMGLVGVEKRMTKIKIIDEGKWRRRKTLIKQGTLYTLDVVWRITH